MTADFFKVDLGDWGRPLKAMAVGLGLFSIALLFLGLMGLWKTSILLPLTLAPLLGGVFQYRSEISAWIKTRNAASWLKEMTIWEGVGFALLAACLVMNVMGDLCPEYFYDSLVYHLLIPA